MDLGAILEILGGATEYIQVNWVELILIYIVSNVISIKVIVTNLLKLINKLPETIKKPLLIFLNKFGKELDNQIPDNEKK